MLSMDEIWKPVPGGNGNHEVSNLGRIRRVNRRTFTGVDDGKGYRRVGIVANGRRKLWFVHQLVAQVFIGEKPPGYHVNHIDSHRANNRVDNLEYVTPLGNQRHSWATTNRQPPHRGEATNFAKLSESDVIQIRRMRAEGLTYKAIAQHFDTKPANVWHICVGRTWKHLLHRDDPV